MHGGNNMNYSSKNPVLALFVSCTLCSSVLSIDKEELDGDLTSKAINVAQTMKRSFSKIESANSLQNQAKRLLSIVDGHENSEFGKSFDKESVQLLILASNLGNAEAQYNLGNMYAEGIEVTQNEIEAVKWWRLSSSQGYVKAHTNLGASYALGRGVRKNKIKAAQLSRLAANQGIPEAQYNLGNMYAKGKGVTRNEIEAVKLFLLAAQKNFVPAKNRLERYYKKGVFVCEAETDGGETVH